MRARLIWIVAFVVLFGSTTVVLFSSAPAKDAAAANPLAKRVSEFWDCRVKGDYVTIYDLMSPDIRATVTRPAFVGSKGFVNYYSYDIRSIHIDQDEAVATVYYTWKANHPLFEKSEPKEHVMEDRWVRIDGTWYKKFVAPTMADEDRNEIDDDDDLD